MCNALWPLNDEIPNEYDRLEDSEMEFLEKLQSWMSPKSDIRGEKGSMDKETVSKEEHERKVSELRERNDKLQKKVDGLKADKSKLVESRDNCNKAMENKVAELEEERKRVDQLRIENGQLEDQIRNLKGSQNNDVVSGTEFRNMKSGLERSLRAFESENSSLKEDLSEAREKIAKLESMLSEKGEDASGGADSAKVRHVVTWKEVTVTRSAPSVLRSEAFSHPVYKVVLSRDGSNISVVPDVEGGALCDGGEIVLPRLTNLVPFRNAVEYRSKQMDDGSIIIELK